MARLLNDVVSVRHVLHAAGGNPRYDRLQMLYMLFVADGVV